MRETYRIVWAPIALEDLEGILDYLTDHTSPETAERVGTKLLRRIEKLSQHPQRCRVVPELRDVGVADYRELIERPYRVFFRVSGKRVAIVGVLDGRRDLHELLLARALAHPRG